MEIKFDIYLATKTKWAHLTKVIDMAVVPRMGEWVKFRNDEVGDYFGFEVIQVEYRESGEIRVMTDVLDNIDNRMYSFEDEDAHEFDVYLNSYLNQGWTCDRGVVPNRRSGYCDPPPMFGDDGRQQK